MWYAGLVQDQESKSVNIQAQHVEAVRVLNSRNLRYVSYCHYGS